MTKLYNTTLFVVAFAVLTAVLALPARASAPSVTVRITDEAAVARSIGACDAGYQLRDEANSGSRLVEFRGGEATLAQRTGASSIAPMLYCAGVRLGFPNAGVELEMH